MANRLLAEVSAWNSLAAKLSQVPEVCRYDDKGEKEAETVVHALADLEQSFRRILDDQLPRLIEAPPTPSVLHDLLLEIGEELRHIQYHIRDPKFFQYLF